MQLNTETIIGKKGIPANVYIDSGTRHYLKYMRGDDDEDHQSCVYLEYYVLYLDMRAFTRVKYIC